MLLAPQPSIFATNLASVGLLVPDTEGFAVVRADLEDGRLVSMLAERGEERLRIHVAWDLDAMAGPQRIQQSRAIIDGLYGERQAPYPGELSNTLKCPEEYRPTDISPMGAAAQLVHLYANERYAFGGCNPDLLAYRATVGMYYDESRRRFVEMTFFAPLEGVDSGPTILAEARWAPPSDARN